MMHGPINIRFVNMISNVLAFLIYLCFYLYMNSYPCNTNYLMKQYTELRVMYVCVAYDGVNRELQMLMTCGQ